MYMDATILPLTKNSLYGVWNSTIVYNMPVLLIAFEVALYVLLANAM